MPFAYYNRLSRAQQKAYRNSDRVRAIKLPEAGLDLLLEALGDNLKNDQSEEVEAICQQLIDRLGESLKVVKVRVKIYAIRPRGRWGELHGLYTLARYHNPARIEVWMRTAQRGQIVAFRTFLRTILHEFCHHLDYELLKLSDSFHTEGFYQRESSLLNQIAPRETQISKLI